MSEWSWGQLCECGHRRGNHRYDVDVTLPPACQVKGCKFGCEIFREPMKYRTKAMPGEIEAFRESAEETDE